MANEVDVADEKLWSTSAVSALAKDCRYSDGRSSDCGLKRANLLAASQAKNGCDRQWFKRMAVFVAPDYSGGAVPGFHRSSLFCRGHSCVSRDHQRNDYATPYQIAPGAVKRFRQKAATPAISLLGRTKTWRIHPGLGLSAARGIEFCAQGGKDDY
jgi:hypothetical protein